MTDINNKKIMITGGAGFIGYHLTKTLTQFTDDLTIYDNLSTGKIENVQDVPQAKFIKGDILDQKTLYTQEKMDIIYHLAAQVVVPYSMENPIDDFNTNAKGTLCVLEKARKDDAKVIFASSAAIYGNPSIFPTPENYGFHPFSCYGLSKVVGEQYCQMYREQYGLNITITRFANVYGPRCHGVIHDFLNKIAKNPDKLEIIGTGKQCRDFIHVTDVVDALIKIANMTTVDGKVYNLGFGKTTSILELANMILTILNLQNRTVVTTTNNSWHGDVTKIWFDINNAKKELNWQPKVTLEDNIKEIITERKINT
jgi:UDP-glucose 4-epimerase